MGVATTDAEERYAGPVAGASNLAVPFEFYSETDLVVTLIDSDGVPDVWVKDTDYTVNGGDGETGSIDTITAVAASEELQIRRQTPRLQSIDLLPQGPFPPDTVEEGLDRLVQLIQEIENAIGRTLRLPDSDEAVSTLATAAARASTLIGFDSSGDLVLTDADGATKTYQASTAFSPANTIAITANVTALEWNTAGGTLQTLSGGVAGQMLAVRASATGSLTVGTGGNINLQSSSIALGSEDAIILVYDGTTWHQVGAVVNF